MKRQFEEDLCPECTHECHPKFEDNPFHILKDVQLEEESSVQILLKHYKDEIKKI